jgi:CheY-like chemotaxis protein
LGQEATPLYDGQSAIEWSVANQPDAVILDIAMPGLDGYEVARRLREHPGLHEVVLVALTGYGQHEDRRRALNAGFSFHLTKPTSKTAIDDLLRKLPVGRATKDAAKRNADEFQEQLVPVAQFASTASSTLDEEARRS